jgi:hypothetical protein
LSLDLALWRLIGAAAAMDGYKAEESSRIIALTGLPYMDSYKALVNLWKMEKLNGKF